MRAGVPLFAPTVLCLGVLLLFGDGSAGRGIEQASASPALRVRAQAQSAAAQSSARATGLSALDRRALLAGETVARPMRFRQGRGKYVGGVAYQLVTASPLEVMTALLTVPELPHILPRTKRARLIDKRARQARIELVQGNSLVEATYTIVLEPDAAGESLRFWLDSSRPHDILDVWGYFRVQPFGASRTLVTVAVALDVGDGLVRLLFEDRIQRVILSAPRQIRDYLEPRALAAVR
jgi:hypothetical protein